MGEKGTQHLTLRSWRGQVGMQHVGTRRDTLGHGGTQNLVPPSLGHTIEFGP